MDCYSCHQPDYAKTTNPNHVASNFPTQCENCHNTGAWKPANFDHNKTRFPLTGAHLKTACTSCHAGGRYAGTPSDCYSCHQPDYAKTTNPNHAAASFPTTCQVCHNTGAWRPASFDHNTTRFPLTGAHTTRRRARSATSTAATPGRRRTATRATRRTTRRRRTRTTWPRTSRRTCQVCHTTTRLAARELQPQRDALPADRRAHDGRLRECHVDGRYTGTPTDCYSCHQPTTEDDEPEPRGSGLPDHVPDLPQHQRVAARHLQSQRDALPADRRARVGRLRAVPRGGRYTGTPTDCYSCHKANYAKTTNPNHAAAGFPTTCQTCHNTRRGGRHVQPRRAVLPDLLGDAPRALDDLLRLPRERVELQGVRVRPVPPALEQGGESTATTRG